MSSNQRKFITQKSRVADNIGWAYPELTWFSPQEAAQAEVVRRDVLTALDGRIERTAWGKKLFTGQLSPGCQICSSGTWGCCFIGYDCTRRCFYCPNDFSDQERPAPKVHGAVLKSPEAHVDLIRKMGIQGTAYSGGEPFLYLDRVLDHTRAIREAFGKDHYIWIYTNGDLVTEENLLVLRDAGIQEIRFDLSARGYDASPLKLARKIIPNVSVEIPVIPEEGETLFQRIREWATMGVDFINLHQLFATRFNYRQLAHRDYHFIHLEMPPVFESELLALKVIRSVLDAGLDISINYCSQIYKNLVQSHGKRLQFIRSFPGVERTLSSNGFVRLLVVRGATPAVQGMVSRLQAQDPEGKYWQVNDLGTELLLAVEHWKVIAWEHCEVRLQYHLPRLDPSGDISGKPLEVVNRFFPTIYTAKPWPQFVFEQWRRRFVAGDFDDQQVKKAFATGFPLRNRGDVERMQEFLVEILETVAEFEETPEGIGPIF